QLVQVGALLDARGFDRVGDAAHRRERGVQHQAADGAGLFVRTTTRGGRLVAEAALDLQAHVQRRVLGQVADHVLGVQDLDAVVGLDVAGGDDARALLGQAQGRALAGVHADGDVLQVQQDFQHVFLQALDRGVLVQHAVDLDLGDREARDRGQPDATQGVAQRVPVAALERLDHDLGAIAIEAFDLRSAGTQDLVGGNRHVADSPAMGRRSGKRRPWCVAPYPGTAGRRGDAIRPGVGCGAAPRRARLPATTCYFEYSSTISASLMSAGRSARSGTALNTPANFFASTSIHDGVRSCCSAMVRASWTRSCFCAFSDRAIESPALTWYDGRFTGLPLTSTPRCETSWRAEGRVTAKPMR